MLGMSTLVAENPEYMWKWLTISWLNQNFPVLSLFSGNGFSRRRQASKLPSLATLVSVNFHYLKRCKQKIRSKQIKYVFVSVKLIRGPSAVVIQGYKTMDRPALLFQYSPSSFTALLFLSLVSTEVIVHYHLRHVTNIARIVWLRRQHF